MGFNHLRIGTTGLAFSLLWIIGCNHSPRFDDKAKQEVGSDVAATLHAYHVAICERGLLAEFAYLDSSEDFHWLPPGSAADWGFDSVARAIRVNAALLAETCGRWKHLEVYPIAWDTARYQGELEIKSRLVTGDTMTQRLKENGVMVRRADGWKLLSGKTEMME